MLKLVISDDEGKKTVVPLVRDEITIGRKEGNTIRLTERNVSRRHARIVRRSSDYVLEDLASYNGIVVNNARLIEAKPVRHGDEIRIGDYTLQILDEPGAQAAPQPPQPAPVASEPIVPLLSAPAPAMAAPGASPAAGDALSTSKPGETPGQQPVPEHIRGLRIVFLAPAGVPPPVMLDRLPMVMGRSEAADVALPFSSISREHARLFLEEDKLMIEDMGSSNGVQVNGEKVKKSQVGPGDMVQLGVVEFRIARRGDSTVVIQKAALEEKQRAARRLPVGLIGAIVGGGLVLGLAVVLAFNKMNTRAQAEGQTVAQNPAPVVPGTPTQVAVPTPPPAENPAAPTVQPETPTAAPTPPEAPPVAPAPPETPPAAAPPAPEAPPAAVPAQPETQPQTQPAVAVPQVQQLESPRERRERERRERAAAAPRNNPPAAAPTPRPAPQPAPAPTARPAPSPAPAPAENNGGGGDDGLSPMQRVRQCQTSGASEPERNTCIINALRGRASTMQELAVLGATYQAAGRTADAVRTMRTYIQRYPQGPMVGNFQRYIDSH